MQKAVQDDVIRSSIAMTCEKFHVLLLLWHYYECEGFCGHWSNGVWILIFYEPRDNGHKPSLVINTKNSKYENLIICDIGLLITYHLLIAMLITCHIGLSFKLLPNQTNCSLNNTYQLLHYATIVVVPMCEWLLKYVLKSSSKSGWFLN
jgi:hypothetical protein